MNLSDYFITVDYELFSNTTKTKSRGVAGSSIAHLSHLNSANRLDDYKIALIGVTDERNSHNIGCGESSNYIREEFYKLCAHSGITNTIDLGDLIKGNTVNDTYYALADVCQYLIKREILPIIFGADQDMILSTVMNRGKGDKRVNLAIVDSTIDWSLENEDLSADNFLQYLLDNYRSNIHNITFIGFQSYLVPKHRYDILSKNNFDEIRLGDLRNRFTLCEPAFRDADIASFDVSAVRYSESPGYVTAQPNGLHGEELCRLARYAGISDKMKAVLFSGANPQYDERDITAKLIAQSIWYFIDGFSSRVGDYPVAALDDCMKYCVEIEDIDFPLVFYRSLRSDRWWVEVSWSNSSYEKQVVPCLEEDYNIACTNEVPETWWRYFGKNN